MPPWRAYWKLIRPGLLAAVLFSMAVTARMADPRPSWPRLANALFGTALLIVGATAMNQLMENRRDAKMARTASRPLPSHVMTVRHMFLLAIVMSLAGVGYLAAFEPPTVALLAAASWCLYVLIYTPLKHVSAWHIPIGTVAGAMPVLIGAATAHAALDGMSLTLFGIVFFWQFSHTAAIGWIYREQYAAADAKIAAVVDPSGWLSGWLAMFGASGVFLTSFVPAIVTTLGWQYVAVMLCFGVPHVIVGAMFLRRRSDRNARRLWQVSMAHLPLLLALLFFATR
jgi:protoheme IX farnesyltransferase